MPTNKLNVKHILYFSSFTFCLSIYFVLKYYPQSIATNDWLKQENILDGCYHVYLDVGSNIGVQIRKLFEPEKYPNAKAHSVFDKNFGPIGERRKTYSNGGNLICAVGFEPNPRHTKYLKQMETEYNQCGWKVKIMTQSGVSDHNGISKFFTDEAYQNLEWGGGVLPPKIINIAKNNVKNKENSNITDVTLIRLSDFLKDIVGTRNFPISPSVSTPPRVVMKMDIEGSEVDVIPDLIFSGGLQYINVLMVEWHSRLENLPERKKSQHLLEQIVKSLSDYSSTMKDKGSQYNFSLVNMDDETYFTSKFEFPEC